MFVCAQTVVDKRKLVNIGTKMGVGLGSVMGTLVAMGNADLKASGLPVQLTPAQVRHAHGARARLTAPNLPPKCLFPFLRSKTSDF